MKKLISFLFFLPLICVLGILALNPTALFAKGSLTVIPFLFSLENIPVVAFLTVFFSLYILFIWLLLKFSGVFSGIQKSKLENEINKLKANLQDGQPSLVGEIKKEFSQVLEQAINENKKTIEILKSENEKTLSQMNYEIKMIKEKINTK